MGEVIGLTSAGALSPTAVELIQDMIAGPGGSGGFLRSGNGIAFNYDDTTGTYTITATGGGGADLEAVRDAIATFLVAAPNSGLSLVHNDTGDALTLSLTLTVAHMPAGYRHTLVKANGVWPSRGTTRTDIIVEWLGPNPHPAIVTSGTAGMYENDLRTVTDA